MAIPEGAALFCGWVFAAGAGVRVLGVGWVVLPQFQLPPACFPVRPVARLRIHQRQLLGSGAG